MRWLALVAILAGTAHADEPPQPPPPTPFDQWRFNLGGGASTISTFGSNYTVIGLGAELFVLPGLGVDLSASHYFGDGPSVSRVTPGLRYVLKPLFGKSPVIPYIGGFYDHYFVGSDYGDVDGVGGRVGLIFVTGHVLLGLGLGVEQYVTNCAKDCTVYFPDFSIGVAL